jgi:uncharacterized protein (TIGR03067 family)
MRTLVAVVALAGLVGAEPPSDAVKKELARLEGEWVMVSGERDGQALPEEYVKTATRVAKDGVSTVTIAGMVVMKSKYTIDPTKKPKAIDFEATEGEAQGKKIQGIYELDGDTLKFCLAASDKDRPTDFTAKEGSGRTASVWKRAKK